MFPKRWKVMFLSYWNRAKQRGQIFVCVPGAGGAPIAGGRSLDRMRLPSDMALRRIR